MFFCSVDYYMWSGHMSLLLNVLISPFFQILFEIAGKNEYFCLMPPCHIVGRCSNFLLLFPKLRFEPANLKKKVGWLIYRMLPQS